MKSQQNVLAGVGVKTFFVGDVELAHFIDITVCPSCIYSSRDIVMCRYV